MASVSKTILPNMYIYTCAMMHILYLSVLDDVMAEAVYRPRSSVDE